LLLHAIKTSFVIAAHGQAGSQLLHQDSNPDSSRWQQGDTHTHTSFLFIFVLACHCLCERAEGENDDDAKKKLGD
jgi:hypothetical protein